MAVTVSKMIALIIAVVYVVAVGIGTRSWSSAVTVAVGAIFLLSLIWFPEEADFKGGLFKRYNYWSPSPAWLVAAMGWFLLVGLPLFLVIMSLCMGQ